MSTTGINPIVRAKMTKPARKRTRTVNLRMTPADYEAIRHAASLDNESISRYVVQASLQAVERTFRKCGIQIGKSCFPTPLDEDVQNRLDQFKEHHWWLDDIARLAQMGLDAGAQIARLQQEIGRLMDEIGRLQGVQQVAAAPQKHDIQGALL